MKILALEFSSGQRSVAVVDSPGQGAAVSSSEVVEAGGRETRAIGMIEDALREARLEREQVECIAVGLGPGSYTGIRAAIALAQGWQLASDVRLLGIGSDETLAAQARAEGVTGRVNVVIDAQRKEFYLETFEITSLGFTRLEPLHLVGAAEIQARQKSGEIIVGPEVNKYFPGGRLLFPTAATLATLALDRTDYVPGEQLEPIYLRQTSFVKAPRPRVVPPDV